MRKFVHGNALTLETIGQGIRKRRKGLGYTLDKIELVTGISKKTLIKLEKGGDVRFSTLLTVLSILGLTLDWSASAKILLSEEKSLKEKLDVWFSMNLSTITSMHFSFSTRLKKLTCRLICCRRDCRSALKLCALPSLPYL